MHRALLLLLVAALPASAAEFCATRSAQYGSNILRCFDFADANSAAINWEDTQKGQAVISTHLFDGATSATAGGTGSLHYRIKSYNQLRQEQPTLVKGVAWETAIQTHVGNWQRWFGIDALEPGKTYWIQFKWRFSAPFLTWWGGSGPKVFGFDVGCRTVNGVAIPPICEQYTGNRVTDMGTAQSMEFGTMTTTNWYGTGAGRPMPSAYRGSTNYGLTWGMTPTVNSQWGTAQVIQPGPESGGAWTGSAWDDKTCNYLRLLSVGQGGLGPDAVFGVTGNAIDPCVPYGAADIWHEWTIAIRSSGNFYDTNPNAPANRTFRHDSLFKVWYDGQLIVDYDPDKPPIAGQKSNEYCKAVQSPDASWNECRSNGVDIIRDSRAVPPGASWCEFACPEKYPGDPGGDLTQLLLWTFSYRRGYPPSDQVWCEQELGPTDPNYNKCKSLSGSGPGANDATGLGQWEAFLNHAQVDVYYDDVVISDVPPPMQRRPAGGRVGAGSFGLDARDIDALPPHTFTRLFPGPDRTFYNTGYGVIPADNVYSGGSSGPGLPYRGASVLSSTNFLVEIPVQIGVPLGGGFVGTPWGAGKMLYFGGGHSGYRANRVNVYDLASGRWKQSSYTPDMSSVIGGAVGPRYATPPGVGCATAPIQGQNTFATTGTVTSGSPVITNIANMHNLCPINGICPSQGAVVGGYAITGAGINPASVIKDLDTENKSVRLTHNATASGTEVAISGGPPQCTDGGTPNKSAGGRGWWEHMDDRYAWDARISKWMLVQNSGTWLYDDVNETWQQVIGPWPEAESMICGSGDYTRMSLRFAPLLNRMLNWCSIDRIYGFDYGSGPPSYTGATWIKLHELAQADKNPNTDVLAAGHWDESTKKFYYLTQRSSGFYGGDGYWYPMVNYFDPLGGASCVTNPKGPCGTSGKLDNTKPNFPQGRTSPKDPVTFAPDTSICWTVACQQLAASLTGDAEGNLYVVGRRGVDSLPPNNSGDGRLLIWKLRDPLTPTETWTIHTEFNFNTADLGGTPGNPYSLSPLSLWMGDASDSEIGREFSLASSTQSLMTYVPERDMFFLILRSGSGDGGASTRGNGSPQYGGCFLNGVPDDCFRMYGYTTVAGKPPKPPPTDIIPPTVAITAPAPGTVSGSVPIAVTATDDVGVVRVDFLISGAVANQDTTPPFGYAWNTTTVPNGPQTLTARAFDAAGNATTSAPVSVTVNNADTIAPTVSITAPLAGATVSGTVPVTVSASDNVGVAKVEFLLGSALLHTDTAAPWEYQWDTRPAPNGPATLTAKAYDAANNVTSAFRDLTVNNAAPAEAPRITSFTATPSVIVAGQTSTLEAIVEHTTTTLVDGVPTTLPKVVQPLQTRTYTLTAQGAAGTTPATAEATVTVTQAPSCAYEITPTAIEITGGQQFVNFSVTTQTHCNWTQSTAETWLIITNEVVTGSRSRKFRALHNCDPEARTGTLIVATKPMTVRQLSAAGDNRCKQQGRRPR